jgi:hypothetical protein
MTKKGTTSSKGEHEALAWTLRERCVFLTPTADDVLVQRYLSLKFDEGMEMEGYWEKGKVRSLVVCCWLALFRPPTVPAR